VIGRLTRWARKVLRPLPPNVSSIVELVEVAMSPSRSTWDYVSLDGPWRLIRVHKSDELVFFLEYYDELRPAIEAFYLYNRPQPDQQCMLIDGHDVCVVGWCDWEPERPAEYRYAWWGSEFIFKLLGIFDTVDASLWEQIALNEERVFE
jgi:hypothetical protein